MSHATTASSKPSFRASWRAGNAVVGIGNAGWTTSKTDIPAHARTAQKGLLQERLEQDPSRLPDDPIGQGTELNGTTWLKRYQSSRMYA